MNTFGIGPGREVGIIKSSIREAILDGIIPNNHESARGYMMAIASSIGLTISANSDLSEK